MDTLSSSDPKGVVHVHLKVYLLDLNNYYCDLRILLLSYMQLLSFLLKLIGAVTKFLSKAKKKSVLGYISPKNRVGR